MLNIEVIRFEAQDVITASVPATPIFPAIPNKPAQPAPTEPAPTETTPVECTCTQSICAFATIMGDVELHSGCNATNHTCGY